MTRDEAPEWFKVGKRIGVMGETPEQADKRQEEYRLSWWRSSHGDYARAGYAAGRRAGIEEAAKKMETLWLKKSYKSLGPTAANAIRALLDEEKGTK